ncbi:MAG TPA: hypothetical protein PLS60_14225 [Arenimonas sp.]|nr:hypothetical protein [Arenimonas sp.]HOZ06534.1 hypothetical protein [Arenimonas sp.]
MTTLCRSDWIEAYGDQELRLAKIDPLKLPISSYEKMLANALSACASKSELASFDSPVPLTAPPHHSQQA